MALIGYYGSNWFASLADTLFCHGVVLGPPINVAPEYVASILTSAASGICSAITLPLAHYGPIDHAVTVNLDVYATDEDHKPTGASLAHSSCAAGDLHDGYVGTTYAQISHTFTLDSNWTVTASTNYAIVISLSDYTAAGVAWGADHKANYPGTVATWVSDDGSNWVDALSIACTGWYQLVKAELSPNKPTNPSPADKATDQRLNLASFGWEAG